MTLIDYLNRVHFAENVLEEAIWAELDSRRDKKICLVSDACHSEGDLGIRLHGALPHRASVAEFTARGTLPTEAEAGRLAQRYTTSGCDMLLVYGPGAVVNLAKAARLLISQAAPLAAFSQDEGGALRISGTLPDLIAVPSLKGFSAGFNGLLSIVLQDGRLIDIASRDLVPTVTVADPTIAAGASPREHASAGAMAVCLCVEALLSPNYNPPASGIALDGLNRAVRSMSMSARESGPEARRELMAALMNAAMVQQKGHGLAHAMSSALCTVLRGGDPGGDLDKGAINRLILPGIARLYATHAPAECAPLAAAIGVAGPGDIPGWLAAVLTDLPLPDSLAEMGLTLRQLDAATRLVSGHRALANCPWQPDIAEVSRIYRSVF